jgi:hypothetical protein
MDGDAFATQIADKYVQWLSARTPWENDAQEVRNYIFATSTKTTQNNVLPWKNSTTLPKLTQIRDNLHANYMAALFSNREWLTWVAEDKESANYDVRIKVESFMQNRLRESGFEATMEQLVLDYIDYGNAFAGVTFVDESIIDPDTGEKKQGYVGPKLYRISPYDIVFDPTASTFQHAAKITRTVKSLGQLAYEIKHNPELKYNEEVFTLLRNKRLEFKSARANDKRKINAYQMDGFGSIDQYFASDMVEILEFEGTLYDVESGEMLEDHVVTIVDRSFVLRKEPIPNWVVNGNKNHVGWRRRPDNLYAQGPLDKLVGMQYRIDHLENLRADAFDFIAYPMIKIKGEVRDFNYQPQERIYIGEDGDVGFVHPDVTVLQADAQIQDLEIRMEEYAGAPKEAMGIRSPGEKTAFEVQQLQNAAGRIFQAKITQFEREFVEPLVNSMFEMARRRMLDGDFITNGILDEDSGVIEFAQIKREDIKGSGKFYPRGARHFAAVAKAVQELQGFFSSAIGQDPGVKVHFSGKETAKLMSEILGFDKYKLYQENVMIEENAETQALASAAAQQQESASQVPLEQVPGEGDVIPADGQGVVDNASAPALPFPTKGSPQQ